MEKARELGVLVQPSNAREEHGEGYLSVPVATFQTYCFHSISCRDFRGSTAIFNMALSAVNKTTVDAMQHFMRSE